MNRRSQLIDRWMLVVFFCFMPVVSLYGATKENWISAEAGESISGIIDSLRADGFSIAYSTALLPPELVVLEKAGAPDPLALVGKILQPHGLTLRAASALHIVTRLSPEAPLVATEHTPEEVTVTDLAPEETPIAEIIVSASRYRISREPLGTSSGISQRTIQQLPDLGEDPIRAVHRLPGTAAGGPSAQAYIRGGEQNDTDIILNGQRLLDPFHIRDFQNMFSAIDARAINGIEVFTGGFPVKYGDRMGGMVLVESLTPEKSRQTELGVSVFNTSFLSAGTLGDDDAEWVVSARRGNLDLVLNEDIGEPSYYDVFAEFELNLSPRTSLSMNWLLIDDTVLVVVDNEPTEREESNDNTRNAYLWMNWSQQWTDLLQSNTVLSMNTFSSDRTGLIDKAERIFGLVDDRRRVEIYGIRQDWSYDFKQGHQLLFGGELRSVSADYNYFSSVDYFGLFSLFGIAPSPVERDLNVQVGGQSIALYLSERWQVTQNMVTELGFRWDKQTYTRTTSEQQFSPRFNILYALGSDTTFRASWGRFYQSQGIYELQIEDGVTDFFPAQRSDQVILGFQHNFREHFSFRMEVYLKSMRQLRPRFENVFNPLAIIPEIEPDRIRIAPDKAYARGLEFSLAYTADEEFSWWATYTLSEVEDKIRGLSVPRSWDQRHAVQVGLAWSVSRWDIGLVLNQHSGWPMTDLAVDISAGASMPDVVVGERNAERFGSFFTVDMRVAYKKPVSIGTLSMYLELSNALNRSNPCCIDFDQDIDDQGNLVLDKEEDYWFPLLPSLGFLWEF